MLPRKVWPAAIAGGSGFLVFAILWAVGIGTALSLFIATLASIVVFPIAFVNETRTVQKSTETGDPFYDRHEEETIRRGRGRHP